MKIAVLAFLIFPFFAFAEPSVPTDPNSAVTLVQAILSLFHNGQYLAMGGGITLLVCFGVNQYVLPKMGLGSALVPWIGTVVGLLSGAGIALMSGATLQQSMMALLAGPMATHLYEMIFQWFIAKELPKVDSPVAQGIANNTKAS